eukprot:jgi/Bigna1/88898/estExt_fgenesh1_pg.C_400037
MEDRYKVVNPRSEDARIDLVICLGGDGTILHANSILNTLKDHVKGIQNLPPVISFAMGSLGFLTPFSASDWFPTLEHILGAKTEEEGVHCSMRTRLICTSQEDGKQHCVLNDIVISRGVSPSLCKLVVHVDNQPVALFQSDGLIISTPSGSTAYSLSAGGSMIAPSVNCTLLTPIAPHSLSSRPIGVSSDSNISVSIPTTARAGAFATFDGQEPMIELPIGDTLQIHKCPLSLPLMTRHRLDFEWFQSLTTKLGWNTRVEQKPLYPGHEIDRSYNSMPLPSSPNPKIVPGDATSADFPPIQSRWRRY